MNDEIETIKPTLGVKEMERSGLCFKNINNIEKKDIISS